MRKTIAGMAATMLVASAVVGCGQANKSGKEANGGKSDVAKTGIVEGYKGGAVELLIADVNSGIVNNPDYFEAFFKRPLQAKYPEISLQVTNEAVEKLLAAGTPPDIVLVSNPSFNTLLDADYPEDLTAMIAENKIDLSRIESSVVAEIKKLGNEKHFYGIPFSMNYGAMVYNKNIFDKFGVTYPKDGMNWNEVLDLAKKLTRTDGGVNYIGVIPPDIRSMFWQYNLPIVDMKTMKASMSTDGHKQVFSLLKEFYSIPGYMMGAKYELSPDLFYKEQRVAMFPGWSGGINSSFRNAGTKDAFNWDVTTFPTYADRPSLGAQTDFHMAVVNKSGKNKEAAHQVLLSIFSDAVQETISKAGRISILTDERIRNVYAADSEVYTGKKLMSIFNVKPAPVPEASIFDPKINSMLRADTMKNVMVDGMDVNTALRMAEEKANKEIIIQR